MSNISPEANLSVFAVEVAVRASPSNYPPPFAARMEGRLKRHLGELFGLRSFGVNLTTLAPGAVTALHHAHSLQDEFVYVLSGRPTLRLGAAETILEAGMCVGFPAGGPPHHLHNRTEEQVTLLEIGDRVEGDCVHYPDDDLRAAKTAVGWEFTHKDGSPW